MQRFFIATMVTVFLTSPVLSEETFFIIYDKAMHGCTITTTEPSDVERYRVEEKYRSESEAEKAITSVKDC